MTSFTTSLIDRQTPQLIFIEETENPIFRTHTTIEQDENVEHALQQTEPIELKLSKNDLRIVDELINICVSKSFAKQTIDWSWASSIVSKTLQFSISPFQVKDRYFTYLDPKLNKCAIDDDEAKVINFLNKSYSKDDMSDERWKNISTELYAMTQSRRSPHFLRMWYYSKENQYSVPSASEMPTPEALNEKKIVLAHTILQLNDLSYDNKKKLDKKLVSLVKASKTATLDWNKIADLVDEQMHIRIKAKNLQNRYCNYLDPNIDKSPITVEEGNILRPIIKECERQRNKWNTIAKKLQAQTKSPTRKSIRTIRHWYMQNVQSQNTASKRKESTQPHKIRSTSNNAENPSPTSGDKDLPKQITPELLDIPDALLSALQCDFN